jgi:hypothetical protein
MITHGTAHKWQEPPDAQALEGPEDLRQKARDRRAKGALSSALI